MEIIIGILVLAISSIEGRLVKSLLAILIKSGLKNLKIFKQEIEQRVSIKSKLKDFEYLYNSKCSSKESSKNFYASYVLPNEFLFRYGLFIKVEDIS